MVEPNQAPRPVTSIVNLNKTHDFDVYIGRAGLGFGGYYGSPYRLYKDGDRDTIVSKYRTYFYNRLAKDKKFKEKILELRGRRLGCFCKPRRCHGDVISSYLNNLPE